MSNEENREVEILHNGQVIGVALEAVNPTVKTHETSVRLADFTQRQTLM